MIVTPSPEAIIMGQKEDLKDVKGAAEAIAGMRGGRGAAAQALVATSKGRREGGHSAVTGRSGTEGVMPGATAHITTEKTHTGSSQGCSGQAGAGSEGVPVAVKKG